MAMGGSITDTTHASVRYMPDTMRPVTHPGAPMRSNQAYSRPSILNRPSASRAEGILAPWIVIQNTTPKRNTIIGMPKALEVSTSSIL